MRVDELIAALERYEPDLEVHVSAPGGCHHVALVERIPRRRAGFFNGLSLPGDRYGNDRPYPGSVRIGGAGLWMCEPPTPIVKGGRGSRRPHRARVLSLAEWRNRG